MSGIMEDTKDVVYALSADPMTKGHIDILKRAVSLFNNRNIHILVANNSNKNYLFNIDERFLIAKASVEAIFDESIMKRIHIKKFKGFTNTYINENNIGVFLRGIRNSSDLEYEYQLEQYIRNTTNAETVYLTPYTTHYNTSSTLVRMFIQSGNVYKAQEFMVKEGFEKMIELMNKD